MDNVNKHDETFRLTADLSLRNDDARGACSFYNT